MLTGKMRKVVAIIAMIAVAFSMCFIISSVNAKGSAGTKAVKWAKNIAKDNTYVYGGYQCHECNKKAPKKYVSTTFVKAAYAHGAEDSQVLDWCEHNKNGYVSDLYKAMKKSNRWKSVGKPSFAKMKPGDVIFFGNQHVEMYYGNGKFIGAHHKCAKKADDISIKKGWTEYTAVMRHK